MTNIAAAIGCAQLERVDHTIAMKREIAGWYRDRLGDEPRVELQHEASWASSVYWMNSILVDPCMRDALIKALAQRKIETRPFFYPAHTLPMYQTVGATFPVAESLGASGINLPSWPGLSEAQVDEVCSALVEELAGLA
jgi:perosamine synthetase